MRMEKIRSFVLY